MSQHTYTEAEFYEVINEALNMPTEERKWPFYALDYIASREEWAAFQAALARWLKDMNVEVEAGFEQFEAEERESV